MDIRWKSGATLEILHWEISSMHPVERYKTLSIEYGGYISKAQQDLLSITIIKLHLSHYEAI